MNVITDAESGKLLGAAILGVGGDEAVHSVLDLIHMGASAEALRRPVHIHPTVAELLPTLVAEQKPVGWELCGKLSAFEKLLCRAE